MKNAHEVQEAIDACDKAQLANDPKLCPMYPEDKYLYCVDCTCRDALRWVLKP